MYQCSIHITEECNQALTRIATKYGIKKTRILECLIKYGITDLDNDPELFGKLFIQIALETKQPTIKEIIEAIFDRAASEGRTFIWQREIHKAINPKQAAIPSEIDKLGYARYIPEGQRELAWKKN